MDALNTFLLYSPALRLSLTAKGLDADKRTKLMVRRWQQADIIMERMVLLFGK